MGIGKESHGFWERISWALEKNLMGIGKEPPVHWRTARLSSTNATRGTSTSSASPRMPRAGRRVVESAFDIVAGQTQQTQTLRIAAAEALAGKAEPGELSPLRRRGSSRMSVRRSTRSVGGGSSRWRPFMKCLHMMLAILNRVHAMGLWIGGRPNSRRVCLDPHEPCPSQSRSVT